MHVNDPEIEDLLFVVDCSKSEIITQSIACVASVSNRVIARNARIGENGRNGN